MDSYSVVAVISANISKYQKALSQVFSSTEALKNLTSGNTQMMGKAYQSVGKALTFGVTAPLGLIGAKSVKTAAEFEAAMSQVKAISGATGDDFTKLENLAREMGATTKFTALESAEALKYMGMAGWKPEQMVAGLPSVLDLAAASGEDLGMVSDIVTDSLTAFGLKAEDTARFADVLAAAATNSNTTVGLMGETFKYAAPVAGALGYSIEDTAVAIGLMASAGTKGSMAGTALRSAFTRLVKPTDEVKQGLAKIGLGVDDLKGKSLHETIDILRDRFKGLEGDEQAQTAAMIFGQRAMSGMLGIINTSAEDYNELSSAINNSNGAAKDMADIMMDNLSGDITLLNSALEGMAETIGRKLRPYVKAVTIKIKEWVDWFNKLDPKTQDMIVKIGLLAAAIGPVLFVFGSFLGQLKNIVNAFKIVGNGVKILNSTFGLASGATKLLGAAFGFLTSPVGLVIVAITAIVGVIVYLWKTNEDFRNAVIGIWNAIKEFFANTFEWIKNTGISIWDTVKETWSTFTTWITETWNAIKEFFTSLWESIKTGAISLWDIVKEAWNGFTEWINEFWEIIKGNLEGAWNGIKEVASSLWELIKIAVITPILVLLQLLKGDWEGAKESLSQIWDKIKENASNLWDGIKDVIKNLTEAVTKIAKKLWEDGKELIISKWDALKAKAAAIFTAISDVISENVSKAKEWAINKFNEMKENVSTAITNMLTTVRDKIIDLPRAIGEAFSNAVNKAREFVDRAIDVGANLISGFVSGVKNAAWRLVNAVGDAINGAISWAKSLLGIHSPSRVFKGIGINTILGATEGIKDKAKEPIKAIGQMASGMIDEFEKTSLNMDGLMGDMTGSGELRHVIRTDESVKKEPVNLTLKFLDMTFNAFVDDITKRQNQVIELQEGGF